MIIQLAANELKAAINCAGNKDIRYYLNGVCVDFIAPEKIVIVATDGHCMFLCNAENDDMYTDFVGQVIIPTDVIKSALKAQDKKHRYIALKHLDGLNYQLGNTVFVAIDGKFPDYRRVIPAAFEPSLAHFNNEVVTKATKAMADYEGFKAYAITLIQNGESAAVIKSTNDKALCVLMPMRGQVKTAVYSGFVVPNVEEKAA